MVCMNEQDQGNLPLHHDTDVNDMRVTNTMQLRDRDCHLHNLHLWSCTTSKQGKKKTFSNCNCVIPMVRGPWGSASAPRQG